MPPVPQDSRYNSTSRQTASGSLRRQATAIAETLPTWGSTDRLVDAGARGRITCGGPRTVARQFFGCTRVGLVGEKRRSSVTDRSDGPQRRPTRFCLMISEDVPRPGSGTVPLVFADVAGHVLNGCFEFVWRRVGVFGTGSINVCLREQEFVAVIGAFDVRRSGRSCNHGGCLRWQVLRQSARNWERGADPELSSGCRETGPRGPRTLRPRRFWQQLRGMGEYEMRKVLSEPPGGGSTATATGSTWRIAPDPFGDRSLVRLGTSCGSGKRINFRSGPAWNGLRSG